MKLYAVRDGDLAGVTDLVAAGPLPRLFRGHHQGADEQRGERQPIHREGATTLLIAERTNREPEETCFMCQVSGHSTGRCIYSLTHSTCL